MKKNIKAFIKSTPIYSRYYLQFGRALYDVMSINNSIHSEIVKLTENSICIDDFLGSIGRFFDDNSFMRTIQEIIRTKREDKNSYYANKNDYLSYIRNADNRTLNSLQWRSLSFIANSIGMHQIGYALRAKAIEHVYESCINSKSNYDAYLLFSAAMDQGDFETAKDVIFKKLRISKAFFKSVKMAQLYFCLVNGSINSKTLAKKHHIKEDIAFADYVKGKRIAVVGPSHPIEENGSEIDTYDIIVRLNHFGKKPSKELVGSEINVSYYNGEYGETLLKMDEKEFLNELDYVVQKKPKYKLNVENVNERASKKFDSFLFLGGFNMIPHAVLDLLMFDIKEVKIFNTNFFLSSQRYISGYPDKLVVSGIALHDATTQINLIRHLWKNGVCKVDNELENILIMSNEAIMERYEELYP